MERAIDEKAKTRWNNARSAIRNYRNFLNAKGTPDRFRLTILDLLYISNFKGGNATISGDEKMIEERLKEYSKILQQIDRRFGTKTLSELSKESKDELFLMVSNFFRLCTNKQTCISGFKESYASALLYAYFSDLIPIADRRVLLNTQIANKKDDCNNAGQVKDISKHYEKLLDFFYKETQQGLSVTDIDEEYFKYKLLD